MNHAEAVDNGKYSVGVLFNMDLNWQHWESLQDTWLLDTEPRNCTQRVKANAYCTLNYPPNR